jgi:hypothetical protein
MKGLLAMQFGISAQYLLLNRVHFKGGIHLAGLTNYPDTKP